ncbi:MAG: DUF983 domain-containing protein [Salaquimonas sp.]
MPVDTAHYPDQSALSTGLVGRCPRCGEGKLYQSLLKPVDHCAMCGLDMSFAEEGDGPAVLVILLLGGVIAGMALALENLVHPPIWVHILLWLPVTVLMSILALRAMKGIMIASQYKTKAAEGQLVQEKKQK